MLACLQGRAQVPDIRRVKQASWNTQGLQKAHRLSLQGQALTQPLPSFLAATWSLSPYGVNALSGLPIRYPL